MNFYYLTKIKRIARFVKKGIPVVLNKFENKRNNDNFLEISNCSFKPREYIWEYQNENSYYGMGNILREYSGFKGSIPVTVEHGLYFGAGATEELEKFNLPAVITYGNYRKNSLSHITNRPVFTIGPYIQYVKPYDNLSEIKSNLGKTLLVFPSHSIETNEISYKVDDFIKFINDVKKSIGAKTVLVSLYFKDIEKYKNLYESCGYKVVCSGYRTDLDFMKKQRSFIELSDYVLTNSLGTHIGYAITLKKPVSFFKQNLEYKYISEAEKNLRDPFKKQDEYKNNLEIISSAFSGFQESISDEQIKIVEFYWGLGIKRTPQELYNFLKTSENILNLTKTNNTNYYQLFTENCDKEFLNSIYGE